jgi:hypothetical protein
VLSHLQPILSQKMTSSRVLNSQTASWKAVPEWIEKCAPTKWFVHDKIAPHMGTLMSVNIPIT